VEDADSRTWAFEPIVWGNVIFVTSAISGQQGATFKPGLYGDGDASDDRTPQQWTITAIDKKTGNVLWNRVAHSGVPHNKRHIKSTYASGTPATDGRIVVAWFGSEGVHAYDVAGNFRWKVDLGPRGHGRVRHPHVRVGTRRARRSSGTIWSSSSAIRRPDSFLIALDALTGQTVWKTERDELPSWGTPTVIDTARGA
jgi:outer membrane protein assembly factor BamB